MTPPRPTFHEGQMVTAEDLNSITAYCDWRAGRLRVICLAAAVISWVVAAVCVIAARNSSTQS